MMDIKQLLVFRVKGQPKLDQSVTGAIRNNDRKPPASHAVPFPRSRQLVIDAARMGARQHTIRGLIEVDVTEARRFLREQKAQTGQSLSFTAFIVHCLGQAIDKDKRIHACRNWRNQLILFDEVDVTTIVEVDAGGLKFPMAHILRAVNKRTLQEIHNEIRTVQTQPERNPSFRDWYFMRWFLFMPAFVRDWFYRLMSRNPRQVKQYVGTVGLTAVGMFSSGAGWGLALPNHTLSVTVGGIGQKPGVVDGRIEIREYLSLTIDADHDIVDGSPLARFVQRFKTLIEHGEGLIPLDEAVSMKCESRTEGGMAHGIR